MVKRHDPLAPHWDVLAAADAADVLRRSQSQADPAGRGYLVTFLGRRFLVDPAARCVTLAEPEDPERVNFETGMVLLVYLAYSKDLPLAGHWITEQSLPTGALFFRGLHALPTAELAQAFGDRPAALVEAARRLGGREVMGCADATVELTALPRVPVRVQLWARDDEFDAHASILFDASVQHQLALDALGSMVSRLVKRLCSAVL